MSPAILRYSAFTTDPAGGNPAGVVLDARGLSDDAMQRIAADVDYSETAFLLPREDGELDVRYFSPLAEVSFCGHATIAAMVAYAHQQGPGDFVLNTQAGRVSVTVDADFAATLTSVAPRVDALDATDLDHVLAALRWHRDDLDPTLPPAVAYAGAWHPIIAVASRARLADLSYDFDALSTLMAARGWTTVNLVWREDAQSLHARNPFPPGGVVEDPATGAAAAALGAYLATQDALPYTRRFRILQGHDLGRPSLLQVEVPHDLQQGVRVRGTAVEMMV
ncbi:MULTISPECIES: PhzF family phenazine biosynthesis isomerase [unclassified Pseudoxanthomonas]|uniref:PhzF family phenazine biosynthesis protein n=1 Tax=unclassified Pseudoxanthomonas TaxID=2645906 RepID=UPI0008ECB1CD|nr:MULTISPECIES: PhzF family phenazine biosynthesis isomerase [unclassified Pseudoxanthomonas]PPJ41004.1 phenazine biosynthesis protein PhzF [Pseudoxanthomonas sp. KAs_5_3]SFV31529.1 phenazine biosynthesis protein PhzF family [Pseudoxanthomonas sp. YR558]